MGYRWPVASIANCYLFPYVININNDIGDAVPIDGHDFGGLLLYALKGGKISFENWGVGLIIINFTVNIMGFQGDQHDGISMDLSNKKRDFDQHGAEFLTIPKWCC